MLCDFLRTSTERKMRDFTGTASLTAQCTTHTLRKLRLKGYEKNLQAIYQLAAIFCHLMQRAYTLEKILMLGKIECRRSGGQQRMRWFDGITYSKDMSLSKLPETVKDREAWRAAVHEVTKRDATWPLEQQQR